MKNKKEMELQLAIKLLGQLRIVAGQDGNYLLNTNSPYYEALEVAQKNAYILAAAPELLEALKEIRKEMEAPMIASVWVKRTLNHAIAKAEGKL